MKSFILIINLLIATICYSQNNNAQNNMYYEWNKKFQGEQKANESMYKTSDGNYKPKKTYKNGSFISNAGLIGIFSNNWITDSYGNSKGSYSNGYFVNSLNQCLGFIKGNQIFTCQGALIATINNTGVFNSQGYLIYALKGDILYYQNNPFLQIQGITMESLAAYLLFFK